MNRWIATAALAAVLGAPAAALAQKVNVDFDEQAQFGAYKTYGWTTGTPSPNPLGETRIKTAVEAALAKAGLTAATTGAPDVVVATHVIAKEQKEVVTSGYGGYGAGWRYGGGMTTSQVYSYTQGTLVLDMFDGKSKQLVWRGTGTDTVSDKADKNEKKVTSALTKMFKQYPPVPKKK
jgi:hypothetical protein